MFNLSWFSLLIHFASFSFQHWTAPLWLKFTVKESLEKCQDSKWEQKFCISKGREVNRDALESCVMLNYFLCPFQRHREQLVWTQLHSLTCFMAFQYSQPCFPLQESVACVKGHIFPRCTVAELGRLNPWRDFCSSASVKRRGGVCAEKLC